jgi:hypothetical protein
MNAPLSIWAGTQAVQEILAFVRAHPQGIDIATLIAKYDLISERTLRAALRILEADGKITVQREQTVYPTHTASKL